MASALGTPDQAIIDGYQACPARIYRIKLNQKCYRSATKEPKTDPNLDLFPVIGRLALNQNAAITGIGLKITAHGVVRHVKQGDDELFKRCQI